MSRNVKADKAAFSDRVKSVGEGATDIVGAQTKRDLMEVSVRKRKQILNDLSPMMSQDLFNSLWLETVGDLPVDKAVDNAHG